MSNTSVYTASNAFDATYSTTKPPATQAQCSKSEESALNSLRNIIQQLTNRQPATPEETLAEAARLMKALPAENARMKQQLNKLGGAPSDNKNCGTGQAQQGPGVSNHGSAPTANLVAHLQPNKAGASSRYRYTRA